MTLCPHCTRPLPASLVAAAFYVCGDPGLAPRDREFAENIRAMILRGLALGPAHREQLVELYAARHAVNERTHRARIAETADV